MITTTSSHPMISRGRCLRASIALGAPLLFFLAVFGWLATRKPTAPDPLPGPLDRGSHPHKLINLGDAAHQRGQPGEAEEAWRLAARLDPRSAPARLRLGMLALERGLPEEALPLLSRASELDPSSFEAYYNLALCSRRLGREAEAERHQAIADRLRSASPPKTTMGMLPRSEP